MPTVHAVDLAGNLSDIELDADDHLVLDLTVPRVDDVRIDAPGDPVNLAHCRARETITVAFDVDEELAAEPRVRVGARPMTCGPGDDRDYACTWELDGCEGEGPWPDLDGPQLVSISVVDGAGNGGGDLGQAVAFDLTAPTVLEGSATVDLFPGDDNPLRDVAAARNGTRVRVRFRLTEPLANASAEAEAPVPRLVFRSTGRLLEQTRRDGTRYTYEGVVAELEAREPFTEWVDLLAAPDPMTDLAGNPAVADEALAGFPVDMDPPEAPVVVLEDGRPGIVYTRIPWGSAATGGLKTWCVHGAAGTVEPGATVLVYDGEEPLEAEEVGQGVADGEGAFGAPDCVPGDLAPEDGPQPLELSRAARERVWVAAADAAGNARVVEVREERPRRPRGRRRPRGPRGPRAGPRRGARQDRAVRRAQPRRWLRRGCRGALRGDLGVERHELGPLGPPRPGGGRAPRAPPRRRAGPRREPGTDRALRREQPGRRVRRRGRPVLRLHLGVGRRDLGEAGPG